MKPAGLLALAVLLVSGAALAAERTPGFVPVELTARQIEHLLLDSDHDRFGELEFRGGLDVTSRNPDFGGLSGLSIDEDGLGLLAVADTGFWFSARLVERDGRLVGIGEGRIAPMLGPNGRVLASKGEADAEGLRLYRRGGASYALVAFEQSNDLKLYPMEPDVALGRPELVPLPPSLRSLRPNQGLETVAVAPQDGPLAGAIVTIAERSLDRAGNHRGWILSGPRAGTFSIRRARDFDITDGDFLPNGDLLLLERRFSIGAGVGMRMRRIPAELLMPGAVVDGPVVISADMLSQIDNMEGLSVATNEAGETIVTIISDDNHNLLQRTLILRFAWREPAIPVPRTRPESALMPSQ